MRAPTHGARDVPGRDISAKGWPWGQSGGGRTVDVAAVARGTARPEAVDPDLALRGLDPDVVHEHLAGAREARVHRGRHDRQLLGLHGAVALGDGVVHAVGAQVVVEVAVAEEATGEARVLPPGEIPRHAVGGALAAGDEILHDGDHLLLPLGLRIRVAGPAPDHGLDAEVLQQERRPALRQRQSLR